MSPCLKDCTWCGKGFAPAQRQAQARRRGSIRPSYLHVYTCQHHCWHRVCSIPREMGGQVSLILNVPKSAKWCGNGFAPTRGQSQARRKGLTCPSDLHVCICRRHCLHLGVVRLMIFIAEVWIQEGVTGHHPLLHSFLNLLLDLLLHLLFHLNRMSVSELRWLLVEAKTLCVGYRQQLVASDVAVALNERMSA